MQFTDVKIITLSDGEVSDLHVGLKGTMSAGFLKDLADKTRRGLRGERDGIALHQSLESSDAFPGST